MVAARSLCPPPASGRRRIEQDSGYIHRRRLGGGLHGIQSAVASRVLLFLDDGGGRGRAARHLVHIRVAASPRRHPRRLLSLPACRGYARVDGGWRSRRHWRRCTTRRRRGQRRCPCRRAPRQAGVEQVGTLPRAVLERPAAEPRAGLVRQLPPTG